MPKALLATTTLADLQGPFLDHLHSAGLEPVYPRQRKVFTEDELVMELDGVAVTITPGGNHEAVAEHTFALMLAMGRSIFPQHDAIRAGGWRRDLGVPLRDRTLGLVGLGRIGREVAIRAVALRMRVIACEPIPDAELNDRHGVTLTLLDQLLAESDFVSLHLPLSPESRHLRAIRLTGFGSEAGRPAMVELITREETWLSRPW